MQVLPADIRSEVEAIARELGTPVVHVEDIGTAALWERRRRRSEVCMVVRRPSGSLLTFPKTFYPAGTYRLLTGGVGPAERVLDALRREVVEETGLEVTTLPSHRTFLHSLGVHVREMTRCGQRYSTS